MHWENMARLILSVIKENSVNRRSCGTEIPVGNVYGIVVSNLACFFDAHINDKAFVSAMLPLTLSKMDSAVGLSTMLAFLRQFNCGFFASFSLGPENKLFHLFCIFRHFVYLGCQGVTTAKV